MCIVAPGQDDAPNDESFVGDAPVDEGNADNVEGVGNSNVVGNGTVLLFLKKTFFQVLTSTRRTKSTRMIQPPMVGQTGIGKMLLRRLGIAMNNLRKNLKNKHKIKHKIKHKTHSNTNHKINCQNQDPQRSPSKETATQEVLE